ARALVVKVHAPPLERRAVGVDDLVPFDHEPVRARGGVGTRVARGRRAPVHAGRRPAVRARARPSVERRRVGEGAAAVVARGCAGRRSAAEDDRRDDDEGADVHFRSVAPENSTVGALPGGVSRATRWRAMADLIVSLKGREIRRYALVKGETT